MTEVTIRYTDGQVIHSELKNSIIAQTFVDGIIKCHRNIGILNEIQNITIHEDQSNIIKAYPIQEVNSDEKKTSIQNE